MVIVGEGRGVDKEEGWGNIANEMTFGWEGGGDIDDELGGNSFCYFPTPIV